MNFEFNVTVDSCMNRNFYEGDFYTLIQCTRLNIFKVLALDSTSISISPDPLFISCFFS